MFQIRLTSFSKPALYLGLILLLNACAQPEKPPVKVQAPSQAPVIVQPTSVPEVKTEVEISPEPIPQKTTFNIAALLPLSGTSSIIGKQVLQGIELALYRYGKANLNLRLYDTQGRRFTAIQGANKAIEDGTDIVIGPIFSHTTKAVSSIFLENEIPILSFSNSNALLDRPNNTQKPATPLFILGITPKEEIRQLIEIGLFSGFKNFALIAPDDAYGQQIHQDMRDLLSKSSVNFTRVAYYDPTGIDFTAPVQQLSDYHNRRRAYKDEAQRLRNSGIEDENEIEKIMDFKETFGPLPFDAVVLITYDDNSLRTLAAQLEYYEVEPEQVKYMGLRQWQNYSNLHHEPSLNGAWFVGLDQQQINRFQQLQQGLNQSQSSTFTALGFDAMAMLAHYGTANIDPIPILLQQRRGILGATGAYRLEQQGTVSRKMSLFEIDTDGITVRFNALRGW